MTYLLDVEQVNKFGKLHGLTPRETEVTFHVASLRKNQDIADRLGVVEKSVRFHLTNVYRKMGFPSGGVRTRLIHAVIVHCGPLEVKPAEPITKRELPTGSKRDGQINTANAEG